MGSSSWSSSSYDSLKKDYSTRSTADIFTHTKTKTMSKDMSPLGLTFRESRDSDAHPESLAIIFALDVTGSMDDIPDRMIRENLGKLMETLIAHGIEHAHVMPLAIGDHECDDYPLQVGQFEAGTDELTKCLSEINLEKGGGGNAGESYFLAWLTAARHTSIDCFEKRDIKGILFTVGDEPNLTKIPASRLKELMGYTEATDLTAEELLAEAQRSYHVFHIHVKEGSNGKSEHVMDGWRRTLGQRLIILEDRNDIVELVAATVAMMHGIDLATVTASFDAKTAASVSTALMHVDTSVAKSTNTGVVTL